MYGGMTDGKGSNDFNRCGPDWYGDCPENAKAIAKVMNEAGFDCGGKKGWPDHDAG